MWCQSEKTCNEISSLDALYNISLATTLNGLCAVKHNALSGDDAWSPIRASQALIRKSGFVVQSRGEAGLTEHFA